MKKNIYSFFGQNFITEENFDDILLEGDGEINFSYNIETKESRPMLWTNERKLYSDNSKSIEGQPRNYISVLGDSFRLNLINTGVFEFQSNKITYYPTPQADFNAVRNIFLSTVISYWLEWKGIPTLHASSAFINSHAVAFLASSGQGKSSIAVSLLKNGFPLVTDDILPIKEEDNILFAIPGFPTVRLWPREAKLYCESINGLTKVHPSVNKLWVPMNMLSSVGFHATPAPLGCIYILKRKNDTKTYPSIEVLPISQRDALIELLHFSFAPSFVSQMKDPSRFKILSTIVGNVPVRCLIYPSGYEHIPLVINSIMKDLDKVL